MIQIVGLFLIGMGVLAIYGRLKRRAAPKAAGRCRKCGRHKIGSGPCDCGRGKG